MRVGRSGSGTSVRSPPERAYLWVPRHGCTVDEHTKKTTRVAEARKVGFNVGNVGHDRDYARNTSQKGSILKKSMLEEGDESSRFDEDSLTYTHSDGLQSQNRTGGVKNRSRSEPAVESSGGNHRGGNTLNVVGRTRESERGDGGGIDSGDIMRRPITAGPNSTPAAAGRPNGTADFSGASGSIRPLSRGPGLGVSVQSSALTGHSVIYDGPSGSSGRGGRAQRQPQVDIDLDLDLHHSHNTGHCGDLGGFNRVDFQTQPDFVVHDRSVTVKNLVGRDNSSSSSGKGKTGTAGYNKSVVVTSERDLESFTERNYPRPHSYLGFSANNPPSSNRDNPQYYSTRFNRSSEVVSARTRKLSVQERSASQRPQTARASESSFRPTPRVISRYHGNLENRRLATSRQQPSVDSRFQRYLRNQPSVERRFQGHLQQQELSRHRAPSSARIVHPSNQRSSSPVSATSSDYKPAPPSAPTPNLYRQLLLASPGPSQSKNVQLNTGQFRPASETVRRASEEVGEAAAARREALSVQRSQSSLSFLGGSSSRAGTPSNFHRYDSGLFNSSRPVTRSKSRAGVDYKSSKSSGRPNTARESGLTNRTSSGARITTRAPSAARISLDSRRHNETSKILDLVGRQPGFLSTLTLLSPNPGPDSNKHKLSKELQAYPNQDIGDTEKGNIAQQNISKRNSPSSLEGQFDKTTTEAALNDNRISKPNIDSDFSELSGDIYRNHWPSDQDDPFSGNRNSPITEFQETESPATHYSDNRKSIQRNRDSTSPLEVSEQTTAGSSELKLQGLTKDRPRRNTSGVVTFDLPDEEEKSSLSTSEESQEEFDTDEDFAQGQTTTTVSLSEEPCEMSAPELPPIGVAGLNSGKGGNSPAGKTPREHKRKTSNHSNHSSGKEYGRAGVTGLVDVFVVGLV
ncbi:hypothetical protein EGW08_004190 [Elysia chlorotica]|uniref:Uncharacterized protein n=1 Tax=Elysia chlorotica TaxID=188477 RepID=A0A3S1AC31_ELYCH|nr:hypothetical protein EGW08_004190 [Elysia chlorotica]